MISVNERTFENRKDIKRSIEADIAYNNEFLFECSNRVIEVGPGNEYCENSYRIYEYGSNGPAILLTGDLILAITVADCYNQTSSQTSNVFYKQYLGGGVMNKDHLVIHKETGICASGVYHYLVNTYYDYVLSFYFDTRKEAENFVAESKL